MPRATRSVLQWYVVDLFPVKDETDCVKIPPPGHIGSSMVEYLIRRCDLNAIRCNVAELHRSITTTKRIGRVCSGESRTTAAAAVVILALAVRFLFPPILVTTDPQNRINQNVRPFVRHHHYPSIRRPLAARAGWWEGRGYSSRACYARARRNNFVTS